LSFFRGGFHFTGTPVKFYGGFLARPPFTVSRKALEFSKRMPPVLQVQLHPWCQIWTDLFQNDCPDLNDIALYFFPDDNIKRFVWNLISWWKTLSFSFLLLLFFFFPILMGFVGYNFLFFKHVFYWFLDPKGTFPTWLSWWRSKVQWWEAALMVWSC
jgi:hypothetical protein